mmetsp:Transcript_42183/g.126173  ORF Transcript_42183/g.126173 Transcript_42183/m.126173 type:complete len:219 (+) Transcript_42183:1585-2241(+)
MTCNSLLGAGGALKNGGDDLQAHRLLQPCDARFQRLRLQWVFAFGFVQDLIHIGVLHAEGLVNGILQQLQLPCAPVACGCLPHHTPLIGGARGISCKLPTNAVGVQMVFAAARREDGPQERLEPGQGPRARAYSLLERRNDAFIQAGRATEALCSDQVILVRELTEGIAQGVADSIPFRQGDCLLVRASSHRRLQQHPATTEQLWGCAVDGISAPTNS